MARRVGGHILQSSKLGKAGSGVDLNEAALPGGQRRHLQGCLLTWSEGLGGTAGGVRARGTGYLPQGSSHGVEGRRWS